MGKSFMLHKHELQQENGRNDLIIFIHLTG